MSLSRDEIIRRVEEHEALCRRQPGERDWRGNLVVPAPPVAEEPTPLVEEDAAPSSSAEVDDDTEI